MVSHLRAPGPRAPGPPVGPRAGGGVDSAALRCELPSASGSGSGSGSRLRLCLGLLYRLSARISASGGFWLRLDFNLMSALDLASA